METMPERRTDEPALSWPSRVTPSGTDGHSPLEKVIAEDILPRVGALNAPTKILATSGVFWGPLKNRGVRGSIVSDDHRVYSLNGRVIGGRDATGTSLASDLGERILLTKTEAKQHLEQAGLPVPRGRVFSPDDLSSAQAFASSSAGPVVVKPNGRTSGEGVATGLRSESMVTAAWHSATAASVRAEQPRPWDPEPRGEDRADRILVEDDDAGLALRVFVTGEQVLGAVIRAPMFVVGDGDRSIRELIAELGEWRAGHAFLKRMTPRESVVERRLDRLGLAADTVPGRGEVCRVQESPNIHLGGLSLDVTGRLHPALVDLAIEARWAIPGVLAAGIDLSVPRISSSRGVVIGVNERASQQIHLYPAFGSPRNVTHGIVDLFARSRS